MVSQYELAACLDESVPKLIISRAQLMVLTNQPDPPEFGSIWPHPEVIERIYGDMRRLALAARGLESNLCWWPIGSLDEFEKEPAWLP